MLEKTLNPRCAQGSGPIRNRRIETIIYSGPFSPIRKRKTKKMKLMYVFCIVLLDACSNFHIATSRPTDSTFLEIAQDPKNYEGKMVTMRGWISLRDEDKNLWATWGDHENWRTPKCVSLINYDWLDGLERKIDGMYVEVSGIIRADASKSRTIIRLASCRDLGIQIAGKSSVKIIP